MSIRDLISDCVVGGELHAHVPKTHSKIARHLFLAPRVYNYLHRKGPIPRDLVRKVVDSQVQLDRFTTGARMSVAMTPHKKSPSAQLARNSPTDSGVWNFRIRDPKPHVRIFGAFAAPDVFVAIDYRNHDGLDFDEAVESIRAEWDALFPGISPVIGEKIDDYVTSRYVAA